MSTAVFKSYAIDKVHKNKIVAAPEFVETILIRGIFTEPSFAYVT